MTELSDQILMTSPRTGKISRFRIVWQIFIPLAAIAFQVNVPLFFRYLSYLELPLLVTVYFSLMRRNPIGGTLIGASIGLLQDALSQQPLGIFGMVKTLVGYFSASMSIKIDVDNSMVRCALAFFFFFFHQFLTWVLQRALLAQPYEFNATQTLLFGLLNAIVAVPLFLILDKLKERG
ncbi:MAG: rod shape-determining protein MreD [Acidobacteria bacterium]|nr:rod shape-determining protein MreD [Acidobacteriota bacterium]